MFGTPGEIRTPDLAVRGRSLYPTELQAHWIVLFVSSTEYEPEEKCTAESSSALQ